MFIGHLPAGYILTKLIAERVTFNIDRKLIVIVGLLGSISPDLDMFYFYLIDDRQHHHHSYVTHFPIVWIALLTASLCWHHFSKRKVGGFLAIIFSFNSCVHISLDSIVGDVWWLAPFIDKSFSLFDVPSGLSPWWLNFVFHWTFLLELLLLLVAFSMFVFKRDRH